MSQISRRAALLAAGATSLSAFPTIAEQISEPGADPIITHEQLAAQGFEPVVLGDKFTEKHEEALCDFAAACRLGIGVLSKTKAELIDAIKQCDGKHGEDKAENGLEFFRQGHERGKQLMELLQSAEARYAIALANVRPDE